MTEDTGWIYEAIRTEVGRQDLKHGEFTGSRLGRSRLAIACLEDETAEALAAWREERAATDWDETRAEVVQVAALAIRALRDAFPVNAPIGVLGRSNVLDETVEWPMREGRNA